ncbi:MAG TPA: hypothetical protein VGW74_01645 [Propionibacteriaceae bacterium]|nr:hypothetical protein [Propionibacteriaceae bacterium]
MDQVVQHRLHGGVLQVVTAVVHDQQRVPGRGLVARRQPSLGVGILEVVVTQLLPPPVQLKVDHAAAEHDVQLVGVDLPLPASRR